MRKNIFILVMVMLVSGCLPSHYDGYLHGVRYHDDAQVRLSDLVEAVHPISMPNAPLKALILPFAMSQDLAVRKDVARELTDIFRLTWLEQQVFEVLEYDSSSAWPGLEPALGMAWAKGANILISGNISQYFEGGATGRTSIALTVEIRWIPDNTLIWSAAQAGVLEGGLDKDYVVVRTTRRLPDNPVYAVMHSLATSMANGFASHGL